MPYMLVLPGSCILIQGYHKWHATVKVQLGCVGYIALLLYNGMEPSNSNKPD